MELLLTEIDSIGESSTQQPSGFVQAMVAEVIMGPQASTKTAFHRMSPREQLKFSGWSMDGWVRWLAGLRGAYEYRMQRMCTILDEGSFQLKQSTPARGSDTDWGVITKTRLISFDWPRGGMFIWVRIHFENHPLWQVKGNTVPLLDGPAFSAALFGYCAQSPNLVLLAPGTMFAPTPQVAKARAWAYNRLCFAAEGDEIIEPVSRRLTNAIQKFWRIKAVEEMEKLVNDVMKPDDADTTNLHNIAFSSSLGC